MKMKLGRKTLMHVRVPVISFLLIFFFLITLWLLTCQGRNNVPHESKAFLTRRGVVVVEAARDNRRRGRKMLVGKQELMLEGEEKDASNSKQHNIIDEVVGVGRKRDGRSLLSEEINVGFVAFNADYHGPTHHPPKNN